MENNDNMQNNQNFDQNSFEELKPYNEILSSDNTENMGGDLLKKKKGKKPLIIVLIVIVALLLAGGGAFLLMQSRVSIMPTQAEDSIVAPTSEFIIKASGKLSEDELRKMITTKPVINFTLEKQEDKTFRLKPAQVLNAGTILKFNIMDKDFSFTVANTLVVTSTMPIDRAENVPVNSGIEIYFNTDSISADSFEENFKIDPPVEGYVMANNDGSLIFNAENGFYYDTDYTITISRRLRNVTGAALDEDYEFSFRTYTEKFEQDYNEFRMSSSKVSYNFMPDEKPFLEVYLGTETTEEMDAHVEIFSVPSVEDYIEQLENNISQSSYYSYSDSVVDVDRLDSIAKMDIPMISTYNPYGYGSNNYKIIEFPESLDKGWYAAEVTVDISGDNPISRRVLFQVSDLSVFTMLVDKEMLVWVNDTNTGKPVENADFETRGGFNITGKTGADGTVIMKEGQYKDVDTYYQGGGVFTVTDGENTFVDMQDYRYYNNPSEKISNQYISYLFTDRPMYRTSDTIQCWGVFRPRNADTPIPENLAVELDNGALSVPIEIEEDGTFTAELSYEYITDGFWKPIRIVSKIDGEKVYFSYESLRIEDYVKPVYTGSSKTTKPIYRAWADSSIGIEATITTFDGTPAPRMEFSLTGDDSMIPKSMALSTNSAGKMDVELPINSITEYTTWYPQSYYYNFSNTSPINDPMYLYGSVKVIHRDLMLMGVPDITGEKPKIEVSTNKIDISMIEEESDLWKEDALKGDAVNTDVTAQLYHVTYEKKVTGSYYDYINKVSKDTYEYEMKETVVDTYRFTTSNGVYTLDNLPASGDDGYYYVKLAADDSRGKIVESTVYMGYAPDMRGARESLVHNFSLVKQVDMSSLESEFRFGEWYEPNIWYLRNRFTDGENITLELQDNDEVVAQPEGQILYAIVQDEITRTGLSEGTVGIDFDESLVPNYIVSGAYFDGKYVYMLQDTYLSFDEEDRELNIDIETDKDSYAPSDQMKVTATVTDQDGNPAPDAQVVLSVVDEAIFAMQEQYPSILNSIYNDVYSPQIYKYGSYLQQSSGGAEKGGGGGEEGLRTDFLDTAEFSTQKTDSSGKAEITVNLPDNITSWRLTSLAIDERNYAGEIKENRIVTRPFFVQPVVIDEFLAGDTFAVGVRSAGTAIDPDTNVKYSFKLEGGSISETKELSLPSSSYGSVKFEKLPIGDYTITISGDTGEFKDSLQLPVSCIASGSEVSLARTLPLKEVASGIEPVRYPVSLSIYDNEQEVYQSIMSSLRRDSDGIRADMRLSRLWLVAKFEESGNTWYDSTWRSEDISDINSYGLLSVFSYSEKDIEFTVKANLAAPSFVDASVLDDIHNYSDYEGSPIVMYLARAMRGQDIDIDIAYILENDDTLTYVEKIYLVMAMYESGDKKTAEKYYDKLVKGNLKQYDLLSGDTSYYIEVSGEDSDACTGAASMLASIMKTKDAEGLVRTLVEKGSETEPYIFERMIYINNFAPSGDGAEITYTLDGEKITEKLDGAPLRLTLNKEQLENANFTYSGDVFADVTFAGKMEENADDSKNKLGITKTITKADGSEGAFKVGDLLKVELKVDLSEFEDDFGKAGVIVEDYMPTGTRFAGAGVSDMYYSGTRLNWTNWSIGARQGQRIRLRMYPYIYDESIEAEPTESTEDIDVNTFTYYVLCANPGTYVVETATVTGMESDVWGMTPRSQVNIEDE